MKKILLQLLLLITVFFAVWFALSRVDWMTVFRIKHFTDKTEEKLGTMLSEMIRNSESEIHTSTIELSIDSLLTVICNKNNIDRSKITLHIIKKDEINAFALPNNHLIVYTGLITACQNESELCGVLCHEIAHIEKHHVMKKLGKEIGLSVLISVTAGQGNSAIVQQILKLLTSTAYDRKLESEADMKGVSFLIKADIDPEPFANFLYRLSKENNNEPSQLTWISTHPESEQRAKAILDKIKTEHYRKRVILQKATWDLVKQSVQELD